MAEQTDNRDMTDEPDRQDLEDRVEQLESTISKILPSRRDALKLGGAALVGGAAMSGTASAGDESKGTIGTANDPVDVESEDISNADTVTTQDLVVNGSATGRFALEQIENGFIFAGNKSGSDAEARLSNALSDASSGAAIVLENANYNTQRTISLSKITLLGLGNFNSGPVFGDGLILDAPSIAVDGVFLAGSGQIFDLEMNAEQCVIKNSFFGNDSKGVLIDDRNNMFVNNFFRNNTVELTSNANACIVDGNGAWGISSSAMSVINNGTANVIGDNV